MLICRRSGTIKLDATNFLDAQLRGSNMTNGDTAEIAQTDNTVLLTEVPSGKTCKLVRVSRQGKGMFRRRKQHGIHDHSEEHQKQSRGHGRRGNRRILRRLLDLGITTGCEFVVVQGGKSGPVLVQVRGTRIALGHRLAGKLLVRVVEE